ncbi:MAG: hypothetical protein WDM96_05995 [Lacunisphaera sp.]
MPATVTPWPATLAGTPTVAVIERAIDRQRLAHSLLLHGENLSTLASVAHAIADRLLNDPRDKSQYFTPKQHPDFLALRPAGKSRQIGAEVTREAIGRIQISPQVSRRKVLVVYEADRMNLSAANIFPQDPRGADRQHDNPAADDPPPTRSCRRFAAAACISASPIPATRLSLTPTNPLANSGAARWPDTTNGSARRPPA